MKKNIFEKQNTGSPKKRGVEPTPARRTRAKEPSIPPPLPGKSRSKSSRAKKKSAASSSVKASTTEKQARPSMSIKDKLASIVKPKTEPESIPRSKNIEQLFAEPKTKTNRKPSYDEGLSAAVYETEGDLTEMAEELSQTIDEPGVDHIITAEDILQTTDDEDDLDTMAEELNRDTPDSIIHEDHEPSESASEHKDEPAPPQDSDEERAEIITEIIIKDSEEKSTPADEEPPESASKQDDEPTAMAESTETTVGKKEEEEMKETSEKEASSDIAKASAEEVNNMSNDMSRDLTSGMELLDLGFLLSVVEDTDSHDKEDVEMRKFSFDELMRTEQVNQVDSHALRTYAMDVKKLFGKIIQYSAMKELTSRTS